MQAEVTGERVCRWARCGSERTPVGLMCVLMIIFVGKEHIIKKTWVSLRDASTFYLVNMNHEVPTVYSRRETICIHVQTVVYI